MRSHLKRILAPQCDPTGLGFFSPLFFLLFGIPFALGGCGNSANSLGFLCTSNPNNTASNLVGTWKAPCMLYGTSNRITDTIVFSGSTATETILAFTLDDTKCAGAIQMTWSISANFSVGGAASAPGFNALNLTITSAKVTPNTAAQAAALSGTTYASTSGSTTGYCGITNWTSGTQVDVSGKNDVPSECVFPTSAPILQIVGLGNAPGDGSLTCNTPINGTAFGMTNGAGVMIDGSTTSAPSSKWDQIFSGP